MPRAAKLSVILILLCGAVSLAACGGRGGRGGPLDAEPVRALAVNAKFEECARPAAPDSPGAPDSPAAPDSPDSPGPPAPVLDEAFHIGNIAVLEPLMEAVDRQRVYIDLLEAALDCYEQRRERGE